MLTKYVGFGLSLLALGLFVPGIILPMFTLTMDMEVATSGTGISSQLVDKELSIITTVADLWTQHRYLVAFLIFVFSIAIPVIKTSLLSYVFFAKDFVLRTKIAKFVTAIGKWSMADVFVVAVFLAVLSTNHSDTSEQHSLSFFGISIDIDISTQTFSMVGQGFYFFTAYCLLSMIGSQLLLRAATAQIATSKTEPTV